MDIKRQPDSTSKASSKRTKTLALGLTLTVAVFGWIWAQPAGAQKVAQSEIWTDNIRHGDLVMQVDGFGKLKSKVQRLLSAPANATVDEIVLKPGASVTEQSVILRLVNPEIEQQVKDARRELDNRNTHYRQLELTQQRDMLSQQADLESLLSQLEVAELEVDAQQQLLDKGIVSAIEFKRAQLQHRQFSRRLDIEQKRLKQLEQLHLKSLDIEKQKIAQQQEQVSVATERFDKLTVRAGINGVLQNLPVELGQSVTLGQQLALVGSVKQLYALLNVTQSQMEQVAMDQIVEIDTRGGKIAGKISRISPVVEQGNITVEVALIGELTANARPELAVDAVIFTGKLTNVTYLRKPVNATPGASVKLFRILPNQSQAELVEITYGQQTGEYMQIIAGAHQGESFILSDMSRWQDFSSITIID
ncbi:MAG: efflux RND transporter periplasmic adaptor subunit [Algicola sp.]|nr:efflux RND transporter periplasmic adaptor subunit [Algicola sp.]